MIMKRYFIIGLFILLLPISSVGWNVALHGSPQEETGACNDIGTTEWFCDGPSCAGGYGFEAESGWTPTSDPGRWTAFYGTPAGAANVAKGSVAMECDAQGDYMRVDIGTAVQTEVWMDFWVYPYTLAGSFKLFNEHSDATKSWVIYNNGTGIQFWDGASNYGSGTGLSTTTHQHVFVHVDLGAGDGSETVQIAINTSNTWDAWDYSATNLSLSDTQIDDSQDFGTPYNSSPDKVDIDDFRIFYGTDMPCEWQ